MCNQYRLSADDRLPAARYGLTNEFASPRTIPPTELFPKKPAYVVRQHDGVRILDTMAWGFPRIVPGKKIDKAMGKPVMLTKQITNVRNYDSGFWRTALQNPERRCPVSFTAFSEYGQDCGSYGKMPIH